MNVIDIEEYADFDMPYTSAIYIGESVIPTFEKGTLREDVIKTLRADGFKRAKTTTLTFSDDYFCSLENKENWGDKRLRLTKGGN